MATHAGSFRASVEIQADIGYKLFVPDRYDAARPWPLILFLHGIKKRGADLALLDGYGLLGTAEREPGFGFLVLAPQCPAHLSWPAVRHEVLALLDRIVGEYGVDPAAVYLTGFSMGGNGVWDYAARDDGRFAAAAPLAGYHETAAMGGIALPVWAFHGIEDDTVPIGR
ncbi:dienelactone hydrolase family protein [Paenibacillus sp. MWE-103]|uniref:Dienelactone hydrolase family protein n=1 Tax=Paenibacillus artemisiicola TaxID=1172618 RepID=A0ABS3WJ57_9BACL|nr:dienelactone hydrolase family protein [Paenibacillus artemisiicola]MBO7748297.1 dienelactone hydrolase family protein [Paenibacillus artemisiicola]